MKKRDVFLGAMKAEEFRRRAWVISAFSLVREGPDDWKKNAYPWRIVQTPTAHFVVNPENTTELIKIDDAKAGEAPFDLKERIKVSREEVPNCPDGDDTDTIYGNVLFNFTCVIWPFGRKIPFQLGRVSPRHMESLIIDRLTDNPKEGDPEPKTTQEAAPIYVYEYIRFADAMFFMAGFTQLCVPAATEKSMQAAPGIEKLKEKLLEENKDRLHDPAVIAAIQQQLVAFDREYLKGDPSSDFLITGKAFNIVRSKQFGMHGAEVGLAEGVEVDLIKNSLSQGWDISKFPAMNNSLRAGSYNRGAQTMLGGESVKWLLRASSNIAVTADDCGSKLGNEVLVDGENYKRQIGFTLVTPQGPVMVTKEDAASYVGKKIIRRSPMFCKLTKTDYCKACVGKRLADNPTGLSSAIAEYGSEFLTIYMQAAHGKALVTKKLDLKTALH
jgi:hypothetical protein